MKSWEMGEKEFLLALHEKLGNSGFGWRDDCIEKRINPDMSFVYSIDSAHRWISHKRQNSSKIFGRWVASAIAGDVIACGVNPKGLSLDIGVDAFQNEDELFNFIDGVLDVCAHYGMNYEGGNLNRSSLVCGISWGTSVPNKIIHRDGAQNNSILLATAYIGLGWTIELIQSLDELQKMDMPQRFLYDIEHYKDNPVINIEAFRKIWELNVIDCGMDLTDGIIEFGYEICDRTGLGVVLSPCEPHPLVEYVASFLKITPTDIMFEPGYDTPFSHGWCVKKDNLDVVLKVLRQYNVPVTILGEVTNTVSGVFRKTDAGLMALPRYWDDKLRNETAYDHWVKNILGR